MAHSNFRCKRDEKANQIFIRGLQTLNPDNRANLFHSLEIPGKKGKRFFLLPFTFHRPWEYQEIQEIPKNISGFLNASEYCGSVLKNDFVVVVVVFVGVLTNFYHIFKESDYFQSLV